MMKPSALKGLCWFALVTFFGYNIYEAAANAPAAGFGSAFQEYLNLFWGRVILADLSLGLAIFSVWILFREKFVLRALGWISLLLPLGNGGVLVYLLYALGPIQSPADWPRFFLGARQPEIQP